MYELGRPGYDRVRPLFQPMGFHLAVNAILEGSAPARIYVDDPLQPRAALARTGRRFYLAGSEDNRQFNAALRRMFRETVYPYALQAGDEMFVLYYAPGDWESQITEILAGKLPLRGLREFYTLNELRYDWRSLLPEGFALRSVDGALLTQGHLQNLALLTEEMGSERASVEDFLDKSLGVCLLHDDVIVGWCLSEYNSADRCEVGIGTLAPYRRRGFATLMASALIEQALSRNISQVGWHCWAGNVPSVATALKVGFEKVRDYPVFVGWYDEAENLMAHGNVCLREGQYEEALAWYERASAGSRVVGWACVGAACAAARQGRREEAFGYLGRAMDEGFSQVEYIENTEHLVSLRGMGEWKALITRMGQ